ncbi:MAG: TonB-dependent receptor [Campylobacterota bacterium]|nr:TonB-dependent receptor [Campylobacterota bacterium]
MNKKVSTSILCALAISASAQDIGTIQITEKVNSKIIENINTKDIKNADLAEALDKKSPSISMIRRSAIANDIILRGQKRDNIKVTIDEGMICGACPNRMDPPTSHVITTNVEHVEISEGPFDVTQAGTLSGGVKITTTKPTEDTKAQVGVTIGSFGYKKGTVNLNGGDDTVKAMLTFSKEQSDQYKDGDGDTLTEQTNINAVSHGDKYNTQAQDMKAYEKQSLMVKTVVNIADNQEIELSATKNESDNVLYPSSGMDAIYDDSSLYNLKYTASQLGDLSKKLEISTFKSDVDHPMSIHFRNKHNMMKMSLDPATAMKQGMTNHLTTDVKGLKIMNSFDALNREFTVGLDTSTRNWDGKYYSDVNPFMGYSIQDTDTKNNALFVKCTNDMDKLKLEIGARYDKTEIDTASTTEQDNDYNSLSGNIFATFTNSDTTKYFFGLGTASRVPDARELYFKKSGNHIGTDTLDQTKNTEIDFGTEHKYSEGKVKAKFFYSMLDDYIYFRKTGDASNKFENIDAKIYGMELSGSYYLSDTLTLEGGYTYKIGKKDEAIAGQNDKDLADITPPKLTMALLYDHDDDTSASLEFINVAKWSKYDSDNGEQALDSYNVVNIKTNTKLDNKLELTAGIDNLLDKTYALSNTYADLTLLSDGTEVMLLNEPGRYIYANVTYTF